MTIYRISDDAPRFPSPEDILDRAIPLEAGSVTVLAPPTPTDGSASIWFELGFSPHGENRLSVLPDLYSIRYPNTDPVILPEVYLNTRLVVLQYDEERDMWTSSTISGRNMRDQIIYNNYGIELHFTQFSHNTTGSSSANRRYYLEVSASALPNVAIDPNNPVAPPTVAEDYTRLLITTGIPNGKREAEWGRDWLQTYGFNDDGSGVTSVMPVEDIDLGFSEPPYYAEPEDVQITSNDSVSQTSAPVSMRGNGNWSYKSFDGGASENFQPSGNGGLKGYYQQAKHVLGAMVQDVSKAFLSMIGLNNIVVARDAESVGQAMRDAVDPIFDHMNSGIESLGDFDSYSDYEAYSIESERLMSNAKRELEDELPWTARLINTLTYGVHQSDVTLSVHAGPGPRNFGDHKDIYFGAIANDRVALGRKDDLAFGFKGNDFISGGSGADTLVGGSGKDTLSGGQGHDLIIGGRGNDLLRGGGGNDRIFGGEGNDRIAGGAGNDVARGQNGNDTILGGAGNDLLSGGAGRDRLVGGSGNDRLYGDQNHDTLLGDGGADFLSGGKGNDLLYGGTGHDTLQGGTGADKLFGQAGRDLLVGGEGPDRLEGGAGRDTLQGGAGADTLIGGAGKDVLVGGGGADVFVFNRIQDSMKGTNRDVIRDFAPGSDLVRVAGIDANINTVGDQAFKWNGQQSGAYSLWTVKSGDNRLVRGDVDGDGVFDFEIQVNGVARLTIDDFIL